MLSWITLATFYSFYEIPEKTELMYFPNTFRITNRNKIGEQSRVGIVGLIDTQNQNKLL